MATALSDLLEQWQSTAEKARLSNLERAEQIKAIHGEIIRRYEPGGPFEARGLLGLEKQKRREVGAEMQQMISSGLYGTTTAAGSGRRWEEAVGEPGRMRLEDIMMQRLSQAQLGMAGFMERIEEPYPDYGLMAGLTQQAAAGGGGGGFALPPAPRPTTTRPSLAEFMREFRGGGQGVTAPTRAPITTTPRPAATGERGYAALMEQGMRGAEVLARQPTGRQIPAQTTPAAMEQYLKTYTPQTGDVSKVPQQQTEYRPETRKGKQVIGIYIDGRRVGTKF